METTMIAPRGPRAMLASRKHTLLFLVIAMAVTAVSAVNGIHNGGSGSGLSAQQLIEFYLFLIGMEWLWVRFVFKGMQRNGRSIMEFFALDGLKLSGLAADLGYAVIAFGIIYACTTGITDLLQVGNAPSNPLLTTHPSGPLGVAVWIGLSLSAGICEEIVFRGYLQRQLLAMTGKTSVAILGQAVLFGLGHGYEGTTAVTDIIVHGLLLGILAQIRGNIRAGILEHSAWDILAGLGVL